MVTEALETLEPAGVFPFELVSVAADRIRVLEDSIEGGAAMAGTTKPSPNSTAQAAARTCAEKVAEKPVPIIIPTLR